MLVNPANPAAERIIREVEEAARLKGLQLKVVNAGVRSEIDSSP